MQWAVLWLVALDLHCETTDKGLGVSCGIHAYYLAVAGTRCTCRQSVGWLMLSIGGEGGVHRGAGQAELTWVVTY